MTVLLSRVALACLGTSWVLPCLGAQSITLSNQDIHVLVRQQVGGYSLQELRPLGAEVGWAKRGGFTPLVPSVIADGKRVDLHWRPVQATGGGSSGRLTFRAVEVPLNATVDLSVSPKGGPLEVTVSLENGSSAPVVVPKQTSLCWQIPDASHKLQHWWVEKAAGRPSPYGVHQVPIGAGYEHTVLSQPYESDARAYSNKWQDRDSVPWMMVYDPVSHSGVYAGVEFTGRVSLALKDVPGQGLGASVGLAEDHPAFKAFSAMIGPSSRYVLPTVFVGAFQGDPDDGCNQMTHWVAADLRPHATDPRYPLVNFDSWGSDMGINAPSCETMLKVCAELGIEQFQIDAGWYRSVGDWRPNLTKFPQGVSQISDEAHKLGLKFGLWVAWTQGGLQDDAESRDRILNVHAPDRKDWFTQDYKADWKPSDYFGANLCLSNEEAQRWCFNLLDQLIQENHIDMLEHDQQMVVEDCDRSDHGHTSSPGDAAYRATLGYYAVYDKLRKKYPDLMFENCVNGGRNVDFGAARRASYFSIVDSYDPLSNRQAIYDITHVMPAAMCECYVMKMPVKTLAEFRSMLRSGLMGWFSLMQDPSKWSDEQKAAAKQEFALYKDRLRPLVRNGNVFHISNRPDGVHWDGMEFAATDQSQAVLYAFRGSTEEKEHTFKLRGLTPKQRYTVHFQDPRQASYTATGAELMGKQGVLVHLAEPGSSQIVWLTR